MLNNSEKELKEIFFHSYHINCITFCTLTHWRLVECLMIYSYSSCGAALTHGVDIENVVDAAAAAAVGRDNDEIRYGSWKFVFADYVIVNENEDFGCCETSAMVLVCNDCCYYLIKHAPAMVLGQ